MLTFEQAAARQGEYQAHQAEREMLKETTLVAVIGGIATGKNWLMQETGYHMVGTITTRKPRPDDNLDLYSYTNLEEMLRAIEDGRLVQYGTSPPDTIHATRPSDYKLDSINVKDIWADALPSLQNKGFKEVKEVSILTPSDQWFSQLMVRREGMTVGTFLFRLEEAKHSYRQSVAKHLSGKANHLLIINDAVHSAKTIETVQAFAEGEQVNHVSNDLAIETAQSMSRVIDKMRARVSVQSSER